MESQGNQQLAPTSNETEQEEIIPLETANQTRSERIKGPQRLLCSNSTQTEGASSIIRDGYHRRSMSDETRLSYPCLAEVQEDP